MSYDNPPASEDLCGRCGKLCAARTRLSVIRAGLSQLDRGDWLAALCVLAMFAELFWMVGR